MQQVWGVVVVVVVVPHTGKIHHQQQQQQTDKQGVFIIETKFKAKPSRSVH